MIEDTLEYQLINEFYGNNVVKRSRVPMINHINEGLIVLRRIGANEYAQRAFCIHPMVQADLDLTNNYEILVGCDPRVIALAMEYRSVANQYLIEKVGTGQDIRLSPLEEVNQMLIADKVQNFKDFVKYYRDTHPRSKKFEMYLTHWLEALDVNKELYEELCAAIDNSKGETMTREKELEEKVKVYEGLLHRIQMTAIAGNNEKMKDLVDVVCNWSYAHRSGNGELSEEEQAERVHCQFLKLKELVG